MHEASTLGNAVDLSGSIPENLEHAEIIRGVVQKGTPAPSGCISGTTVLQGTIDASYWTNRMYIRMMPFSNKAIKAMCIGSPKPAAAPSPDTTQNHHQNLCKIPELFFNRKEKPEI